MCWYYYYYQEHHFLSSLSISSSSPFILSLSLLQSISSLLLTSNRFIGINHWNILMCRSLFVFLLCRTVRCTAWLADVWCWCVWFSCCARSVVMLFQAVRTEAVSAACCVFLVILVLSMCGRYRGRYLYKHS